MRRIPISKVLDLTQQNKFEVICATFDAVDHIFKVDIPRSLKGRKSAIQAMTLLADDQLKYGYDEYSFQNSPEDESTQEVEEAEEIGEGGKEPTSDETVLLPQAEKPANS